MSKTYKATVAVATREGGHTGWYQSGKFWGAGTYENVELTEEEVQGLARRPGIVVLIGGKAVKPSERSGPATQTMELTQDEAAALEKYRRERVLMAQAEQEASSGGKLEFTGEKKNDAVRRAFDEAPGSTNPSSADAPLQDADILHGKPPPEPGGTTLTPSKPLEKPAEPKGKGK